MAGPATEPIVFHDPIERLSDKDWTQRYLNLCAQHVQEHTAIQCCIKDDQGRPALKYTFGPDKDWTTGEPTFSFQLQLLRRLKLTNYRYMSLERLVQLSFICRCIDNTGRFHLLMELYCNDPDRLYRQFQIAKEVCGLHTAAMSLKDPLSPLFFLGGWNLENTQDSRPYKEMQRTIKDLNLDLGFALRCRQFSHFLIELQPVRHECRASFKTLVIETASLVMDQYRRSEAFRWFVIKDWHPSTFELFTNGATPFMTGLRYILSQHLARYQENLMVYMRETWPRYRVDQYKPKPNAQEVPEEERFDEKPFQLAFAPTGSGKTTAILKEFSKRYGHYLVSSALPRNALNSATPSLTELPNNKPTSKVGQSILDPKTLQGVPRDTYELHKWLGYAQSLTTPQHGRHVDDLWFRAVWWKRYQDSHGLRLNCMDWWRRIMELRHRILRLFCKALGSDCSSILWLSFQLDCCTWDPFLDMFRVLALFPGVTDASYSQNIPDSIEPIFAKPSELKAHWACVDEAQEDLRIVCEDSETLLRDGLRNDQDSTLSKESIAIPDTSETMLSMAMGSLLQSGYDEFRHSQQMIFTGTSLNVNKVLQTHASAINPQSGIFGKWTQGGSLWQVDGCKLTVQFPLIMNRTAARQVLSTYGLNDSEDAVEQSKSLWGRIKWTAMYAERILDDIQENNSTELEPLQPEGSQDKVKALFARKRESVDFRHLASDTYETVIAELIAKLDHLEKRGNSERLLDNLLEAAFSADILDRPHVLDQERDVELVEHGFAIVESWEDRLEADLASDFAITKSETQITAKRREDCDPMDSIIHLLDKVVWHDLAVVGCRVNKLSADIVKEEFVILDGRVDRLAAKLERQSFAVSRRENDQLAVHLVNHDNNAERRLDQLTTLVQDGDFKVENHAFDTLTVEIMSSGFTVWTEYRKDKVIEAVKDVGFQIVNQTGHRLTIRYENADETHKSEFEKLFNMWRKKFKKKGVVMNGTMDQLLFEWSNKGFIIKADPVPWTQLKRRLDKQGLQDSRWSQKETSRLLPAKSATPLVIRDQELASLEANLKSSGFIIIDLNIEELTKLAESDIAIMKPTDEMVAEMSESGFITWAGTASARLETMLEQNGCTVIENSTSYLTVRGPSNNTHEHRRVLADQLAKEGFPMVKRTKSSLVLKLAERVVIDAVIRFSLGRRLDEKLTMLLRLVANRTGLGHLAEHYLAVVSIQVS